MYRLGVAENGFSEENFGEATTTEMPRLTTTTNRNGMMALRQAEMCFPDVPHHFLNISMAIHPFVLRRYPL